MSVSLHSTSDSSNGSSSLKSTKRGRSLSICSTGMETVNKKAQSTLSEVIHSSVSNDLLNYFYAGKTFIDLNVAPDTDPDSTPGSTLCFVERVCQGCVAVRTGTAVQVGVEKIAVGLEVVSRSVYKVRGKKKTIPIQEFVHPVHPEDLILFRDPFDDAERHFLAEVVSIEQNGDISVNLFNDKNEKVPYYIPNGLNESPFMERIIPVMQNPAVLLKDLTASQAEASQFNEDASGSITGYHLTNRS